MTKTANTQNMEQSNGSRLPLVSGYLPSLSKPEESGDCAAKRSGGRDDNTQTLFDASPDWQKEWQGMPEFVQERQREYAKIIVRFRCKEDLDDFARLIGQRLNQNSQCTWHPELKNGELQPKVKYVAKP